MMRVQFNTRKVTQFIIIHCSATRPSQDVGVREIRQWHKERGMFDVGYHYVIRRDGTIETGRKDDQMGAHTRGKNEVSVGVCLVGGVDGNLQPEPNFTKAQLDSCRELVEELLVKYPQARVAGHNQFAQKACPSFKADVWWETGEIHAVK